MTTDFTRITASGVQDELMAVSAEARAVFDALDDRQFNWRPSEKVWSVAQCFEHLLKVNRSMCVNMTGAIEGTGARSMVRRIPLLPGLFGPLLVKSQSPVSSRRITTAQWAEPAASALDRRMLDEFVDYNSGMSARLQALSQRELRVTMVSPFASFVVYRVLDGWRLIAAHNWRHVEQARRVTTASGFPR